jgi:hypothetical protein
MARFQKASSTFAETARRVLHTKRPDRSSYHAQPSNDVSIRIPLQMGASGDTRWGKILPGLLAMYCLFVCALVWGPF